MRSKCSGHDNKEEKEVSKVLVLNGSPHAKGCTAAALEEVIRILNEEGIGTELIQVGAKEMHGCVACGFCDKNGKCRFDDLVNEEKARIN